MSPSPIFGKEIFVTSKSSVISLVIAMIALGVALFQGQPTQTTQTKETTYERVMRTKTLRCGYFVTPPYIQIDPNTKTMTGAYYDLVEKMGQDWGIKIEWAEEVGTASMFEGLKTGRYDLLCSPNTLTATRTLIADFSRAIVYNPFYLYVRENDHRFDGALDKANDESITMLSYDGYFGATIIKDDFPKAKLVSLPDLSNDTDILLGVSTGKADAGICGNIVASNFIKNNPGTIRRVGGPPLRFPSLGLAFAKGEEQLKAMINASLTYYQETGVTEKILNKYDLDEARLFRPATPYKEPSTSP